MSPEKSVQSQMIFIVIITYQRVPWAYCPIFRRNYPYFHPAVHGARCYNFLLVNTEVFLFVSAAKLTSTYLSGINNRNTATGGPAYGCTTAPVPQASLQGTQAQAQTQEL